MESSQLGISIRTVFRILRTRKEAEKAPVAPPVTRTRKRARGIARGHPIRGLDEPDS